MRKEQLPPYRAYRVARLVGASAARYEWLSLRARWPRLAPADGAWERAHERAATGIHDIAVDLGGLFVKGAQVAGARADFLPEPFIRRLGRFHDRVPARPFEALRPHVEARLGRRLDEVFERVEAEPLAAASLAQVHRAQLRRAPAGWNGDVVLKIQYPEARRLFRADLASLRRAARAISRLQRRFPVRELVDELTHFVGLELDFAREADATERIAAIFAGDPTVRVPRVVREHSSDRLLVLEYLEGTRITDVDALRARGVDVAEVCARVARLFVRMIFDERFFHGDPHPGNLLVLGDGAIGLLDHGLAKELPPDFGAGVAALLVRGFAGDGPGAARAARQIGFELAPGADADLPALVRAMLGQIRDPATLAELMERSPVRRVPPHMTLVLRVLILLNGLSHTLAPGRMLVQQELLRAIAPHAAAARGGAEAR